MRWLEHFEEGLIAFLMAAMTLVTFMQVVARYVFNYSFVWALELTGVMFAWLIFTGMSYGVRVGAHIGVDALVKTLSARPARLVAVGSQRVRHPHLALAAVAQISPHAMLGDLVNLSADALAAAEATTQRKANEYETLFGEAWEQVLRLAAAAAGDTEAAADESAQVRWRDTEARSFAATVDALGKMVQMLGVPPEAAWERIPGVTAQDVEAWKALRASADVFGALVGDLNRQVTANPGTAPAPEVAQPV